MNNATKQKIIAIAENFLDEKGYSANEFCQRFGIPANYFSFMRKGIQHIDVGDKKVPIDDRYYRMIAVAVDYDITETEKLWKHVDTSQSTEILAKMADAKEYGLTSVIIGKTGAGKTYSSNAFVKSDPKNNIKITVGAMDNISDFLEKICDELKLPQVGSKSKKIKNIINELKRLNLNGRKPTLIFDECEYMKITTLANSKELYDHLNNNCGLIFLGAPEFLDKIERLKMKGKPGMAQWYRRIKFRITKLKDIDTRFHGFIEDIEDPGLVKLLQRECENYGELHDVLVPAKRESIRLSEPLTENLVRKMLNMPNIPKL
ncbi:MuB-like transposase [Elizabethkingia phage TCUEAP3]|nr:MuB-like transposase [Elizabethkingia phage TCUEAP3]